MAPHQVLIAGTGERALRLAKALESSSEYDVRLRGFLSEDPDPPTEIALVVVTSRLAGERAHVHPARHVMDEIIFAVGSESLAQLEEAFLLCDEEGVRTRVAVDFFPHVNSTV